MYKKIHMHFIEKKGLLFMKQGSKIGIVCCSNGLRPEQAETIKCWCRFWKNPD